MSGSLLTSVLASLLSVSVIAALIQASVTMRGWSVTRRREQEQLERDAELRHLERQIEELYGPLLGLVRQRQTVYEVVKKLVPVTEGGGPNMGNFEAKHWPRWNALAEDYLIPIQREMSTLLWGKIYLLKSGMLPESFNDFIANASQFECLYRVAARTSITSSDVPGKPWPEGFEGEVAHTLDELKKEYNKRLHRQVPPAVNAHAASARGLPP
jgi:hypothetical protein